MNRRTLAIVVIVVVCGLTYYYTVDSMEATGMSDGVKSSVNHFSTP